RRECFFRNSALRKICKKNLQLEEAHDCLNLDPTSRSTKRTRVSRTVVRLWPTKGIDPSLTRNYPLSEVPAGISSGRQKGELARGRSAVASRQKGQRARDAEKSSEPGCWSGPAREKRRDCRETAPSSHCLQASSDARGDTLLSTELHQF